MGQLEDFRASLKRKDSAESSEGETIAIGVRTFRFVVGVLVVAGSCVALPC